MNLPEVILASSSPRRRELLASAGFDFKIVSPGVAEKFDAVLSPRELALLNATRKGTAVARLYPDKVVVAADTLVALDGQTIGKPANLSEAKKILSRLSGRVHEVYSAVFIGHWARNRSTVFCDTSHVRFRRLSRADISNYLAQINPLDKAGAYAAQGHGGEIIAGIEGSYSNVIGLPMERTVATLHQFGITPSRPA